MKYFGPESKYFFCLPCFAAERFVRLQHNNQRQALLCPSCGAGYTDQLVLHLIGLHAT